MNNPKAIVFDLDGTLIHSAPDLHAAANSMLSSLERPNTRTANHHFVYWQWRGAIGGAVP